MIKTETLVINGKECVRTWSDRNVMLERDGVLFNEAVDPAAAGRVYTEALDHPIIEELTAEEALDILLGGGGA